MWHPWLEWKVLYRVHFRPDCPFCPVWLGQGHGSKKFERSNKPTGRSRSACFLHIRKHWVRSIYKPMTGWSVKIRPPATPSFISSALLQLSHFSLTSAFTPARPCFSWSVTQALLACADLFVCACFSSFNCGFWSATGQHGLLEDHHCRCSCGCNYSVRL